MKYSKKLIFGTCIILSSCASMITDIDFRPTVDLLDAVSETCNKNFSNQLIAAKECFPLLEGKEVLITANKVSADPFQTILLSGDAGRVQDAVWCKLSKQENERLQQNPNLIVVGSKYWVRGRFDRYTRGISRGFWLSECSFRSWTAKNPI